MKGEVKHRDLLAHRMNFPLLLRWLTLSRQYFQSLRVELNRCGV